ncbi:MAG: sulfotransferase family protein [Hyphomicrobiaceae bacterium]
MALQVVGAGLGRTGTNSLKYALEQLLGGKCHHMFEVMENPDEIPVWHAAAAGEMPDWTEFLDGFTALVDWPGASFWPELSAAFPDAIVLLSVRDPEDWYASATKTIFRTSEDEPSALDEMWRAITRTRFCDAFEDKEKMIAAMLAHNNAVKAAIPQERLVVYPTGAGWQPLGDALHLPLPDTPFPHRNTTADFLAR